MVGGAAGDDHDALDVGEDRLVERALLVEVDAIPARHAIGDRLGDGVGLFVDLLEHERLIAALLGGLVVPVDLLDRRAAPVAGEREDRDAVGAQTTISPFSMYWTVRVWARKAGTAEATNCSPSPLPTTSGHSLRAPTSVSGSSTLIATNAKWPWISAKASRTAAARSPS